jgi:hypothetical protein
MWKEALEALFEGKLNHQSRKKKYFYDSQSLGRDLNHGPNEYEAGTLPIRPRCSVRYLKIATDIGYNLFYCYT